ncbi:methyl-accepting chemotaxis protein [Cellulomonas fimi]|uniref:Methyl-accepting chemotaxis sensory transducer n=1 Tax=Cellulomonas fimi (strain ATCC 484 / DSM 20113 / JCM 1341 / CCUG 24087 / LMG 16345 / NBRC 15513 / NCIMB 8980 / NCTC 7547 / NRS-133) TaxID=590998 RepID=F4GYA3_CELFA|nr:methyl-accepting chemotaxis protein [Cellulomonas fimi]AEE45892.1 methyl-accepting chemotaxis sensory transducer [Cellulomonas fimi ATCC 484]NNH06782.1 chemotaxis protein [Cellulomonas fimi]VEH30911.1 Chemotaxis regulator BdlA [Cellulomonas fimi]
MRRARDAATAPVPLDGGALAPVVATLRRAAGGDLEARVPELADPALAELGDGLNALLDVVDAFVRESGAALTAAAEGRFHRTLVERGMPGAYRDGARRINAARDAMRDAAAAAQEQERVRTEIGTQAVEVSQHVAAASTELGASAGSLRHSVREGVDELASTVELVGRLREASATIGAAVTLIQDVSARTRLLALNATIEAARAGDRGRAFAVVAGEVRSLSDRVASSSADIADQVAHAQEASRAVDASIGRVATLIAEIDTAAAGVADAAGHDEGGLARMAETLRADIGRFAH